MPAHRMGASPGGGSGTDPAEGFTLNSGAQIVVPDNELSIRGSDADSGIVVDGSTVNLQSNDSSVLSAADSDITVSKGTKLVDKQVDLTSDDYQIQSDDPTVIIVTAGTNNLVLPEVGDESSIYWLVNDTGGSIDVQKHANDGGGQLDNINPGAGMMVVSSPNAGDWVYGFLN